MENGAKNKNNLTKFVGVTYLRPYGSNGEFVEIASARGTILEIDVTKVVDVRTDTRGTVDKGVIPVSSITLTFLENAGADMLAKLFGVSKTAVTGGAKTFTAKAYKFNAGVLELDEVSNDGLGVTSLVIKDSTGVTTYVLNTDYTVSVVNNITKVTAKAGGALIAGDLSVQVSGGYNANASENVTITSKFMSLPEFEVKIRAVDDSSATPKYRTILGKPVTLNANYGMEFIDYVKAGDIKGATLKFDISEGGKVDYINEII